MDTSVLARTSGRYALTTLICVCIEILSNQPIDVAEML
jgi:hypothetical protein